MSAESFLSHIEALRKMLLEVLVIFLILLLPGWFLAGDVLSFLQDAAAAIARKHGGSGSFELYYFSPLEPFMLELKTGSILALAAGVPLYFWRGWHFLAPALYKREKRMLLAGCTSAWLLFALGCAIGFFGVMPLLVKFSYGFARDGLMPMIGYGNFLELAMIIALAFGLMFEFPLILLIAAAVGIIKLDTLKKQRPLVLVVVLVLAAVLTPPDVISQMLLAIPTWMLFELMLLIGSLIIKPPAEDGAGGQVADTFSDTQEHNVPHQSKSRTNQPSDPTAVNNEEVYVHANTFLNQPYRRRRKRHKPTAQRPGKKGYNYHA